MSIFFSILVFLPDMVGAMLAPLHPANPMALDDACRYDAVETCARTFLGMPWEDKVTTTILCHAGDCACHERLEKLSWNNFNKVVSTGKLTVYCSAKNLHEK